LSVPSWYVCYELCSQCKLMMYVEPPAALCNELFPWVESEQAALAQRRDTIGPFAADMALHHFLQLLIFLRQVVMQDTAVLSLKYPECPIFRQSPFDSLAFRAFSATSAIVLETAEREGLARLSSLPQNVANSFRGLIPHQPVEHN